MCSQYWKPLLCKVVPLLFPLHLLPSTRRTPDPGLMFALTHFYCRKEFPTKIWAKLLILPTRNRFLPLFLIWNFLSWGFDSLVRFHFLLLSTLPTNHSLNQGTCKFTDLLCCKIAGPLKQEVMHQPPKLLCIPALLLAQITGATRFISVVKMDDIWSSYLGSWPFRNQGRPESFLYLGVTRMFLKMKKNPKS